MCSLSAVSCITVAAKRLLEHKYMNAAVVELKAELISAYKFVIGAERPVLTHQVLNKVFMSVLKEHFAGRGKAMQCFQRDCCFHKFIPLRPAVQIINRLPNSPEIRQTIWRYLC